MSISPTVFASPSFSGPIVIVQRNIGTVRTSIGSTSSEPVVFKTPTDDSDLFKAAVHDDDNTVVFTPLVAIFAYGNSIADARATLKERPALKEKDKLGNKVENAFGKSLELAEKVRNEIRTEAVQRKRLTISLKKKV